jgi:hypothetical protein
VYSEDLITCIALTDYAAPNKHFKESASSINTVVRHDLTSPRLQSLIGKR